MSFVLFSFSIPALRLSLTINSNGNLFFHYIPVKTGISFLLTYSYYFSHLDKRRDHTSSSVSFSISISFSKSSTIRRFLVVHSSLCRNDILLYFYSHAVLRTSLPKGEKQIQASFCSPFGS